jgi:hypothetical protein
MVLAVRRPGRRQEGVVFDLAGIGEDEGGDPGDAGVGAGLVLRRQRPQESDEVAGE